MACRILHKCLRLNAVSPNTLTYSVLRTWQIQSATYATKLAKKGGAAGPSKKKTFEVETDAKILCTHLCGGNIYKEGEDPVIGPDEEYPDWLWDLRTNPEAVPLEELDQNDITYWRRLRRLTIRQNNALRSKQAV